MVRSREFDEHKVLDTAMHLFWEKGYEAASLNDLTAAMGIQKPSIYSAFGNKEELFETALRKYTQMHASAARAQLSRSASVKEAFREYFEQIVAQESGTERRRGCFCINTMVELAPHHAKFEILTREHQNYLAALFEETIKRGIRSGELSEEMNAQAVAQSLLIALIGLTVLLKSRPEPSLISNAITVTLTLLH
ncbi:TetR/AcrR family transcriptional repressor of nem operon [Paenibacillus endophyticus]|uniref:TetR/AcrR family transcriptional repressor of nem operon n=1 Tax=Paenibacillus endophyticus TaxID=1294268 RepID=A0A7W5G8T5_9BACL|nr:TetR/AcrR family transcriptional regulator [Paenibacillus endophyticus]MBB3151419.1 TetR/AcrR family transcriptional repressor of nem operon [Paenibacillus endophyticus]